MLAQILAVTVGFASFNLYMVAFFLPEVHRKYDLIWSGVGMFYALVLWVCAGRITGGVLLGQTASVALLGWLGWQMLSLRRSLTPVNLQTQLPGSAQTIGEAIQIKLQELQVSGKLNPPGPMARGVAMARGWIQSLTKQNLPPKRVRPTAHEVPEVKVPEVTVANLPSPLESLTATASETIEEVAPTTSRLDRWAKPGRFWNAAGDRPLPINRDQRPQRSQDSSKTDSSFLSNFRNRFQKKPKPLRPTLPVPPTAPAIDDLDDFGDGSFDGEMVEMTAELVEVEVIEVVEVKEVSEVEEVLAATSSEPIADDIPDPTQPDGMTIADAVMEEELNWEASSIDRGHAEPVEVDTEGKSSDQPSEQYSE